MGKYLRPLSPGAGGRHHETLSLYSGLKFAVYPVAVRPSDKEIIAKKQIHLLFMGTPCFNLQLANMRIRGGYQPSAGFVCWALILYPVIEMFPYRKTINSSFSP